ncbi:MAG: hypothetical protein KZY61_01645 [Clostridiaceae bacterium]|nr:hypothetical protein [Clostridiaceae bacterium]MBW4859515.1 hypothetical protein [Clostridiaceae bacterium]MBW4867360.1 hypothetical protein [Clostridiaceae bacterium]
MNNKNTSIKILNTYINRKTVLIIYIFVQMLLHFLAFKALNKYEHNIIEYLSIYLALIYSFIVYLVLLLNTRNKKMMYYYCISTIILSFFLITDLGYLKSSQIRYNYIQIIVLFIMLDITLKILTQNIAKRLFYKYIVIVLWTIGIVLGLFKRDVYMLIYQITFLIVTIYPLIFLIYNYKRIKSYGNHLFPMFLIITLVNIIFISLGFLAAESQNGMNNYDFYIYLNLIELFLSYLILSALGFWELIKSKKYKMNWQILFGCIFIMGYIYCGKENLELSIFSIFSFFVILKQSQLLDHYIKLVINKSNGMKNRLEVSNLFKNIIEKNISDFKKEELHKEQVADFLHDEILQDVIYIKKELLDSYKISVNDNIFKVANKMINTTRGQISLYKPHINYDISLAENYYNLIKSLKNRFGIDNILVDFVCDDKLFLSSPYDLVVYRMIHELVTNIFKHSKGEYSVVELEVDNNVINLSVINYGDYLENGFIMNTDNRGLKIIEREIDRFNGTLDINSSIDSDILVSEDKIDESIVNITIKIPIKGEMTYENFINR